MQINLCTGFQNQPYLDPFVLPVPVVEVVKGGGVFDMAIPASREKTMKTIFLV